MFRNKKKKTEHNGVIKYKNRFAGDLCQSSEHHVVVPSSYDEVY